MATYPLIVIFGADGMLGSALMREAQRRDLRHHLHGRSVDITSASDVLEALNPMRFSADGFGGPVVIINAAAWTHMDACEQDPEKAFAINAWGPQVLARAVHGDYHRFVHISTGAVFDGIPAPGSSCFSRLGYDEFEPTRPVSVYAKTKWAGEELVRELCPKALIVRLGHLYGSGGKTGLSTARERLLTGQSFSINDHCRIGPTYVDDAARVILDAITQNVFGTTLHVAPDGSISAYGFAELMQIRLGCRNLVSGDSLRYPIGPDGPGHKVLGVSGPVLARELAWRPDFQLIRSSVLRHHGIRPIGPWEEGLDRYLQAKASS
jgi:dTDP-4-dehydrorhamnose reductase